MSLFSIFKIRYCLNNTTLDQSQKKAVESVLTNQISIIQGPPGTGKTFVGSKIVQLLLKAKYRFKCFKGPIFVVCYTNHALDQFLSHILEHTQRILRIGGGSKNEDFFKWLILFF